MDEVASQFVSSVNSIVDSKLENFTPSSLRAVETEYPTVTNTRVEYQSACGDATLCIFFDITDEAIEFYQNHSMTFNLHLVYNDGSEYDGTISATYADLRSYDFNVSVNYPDSSNYPLKAHLEGRGEIDIEGVVDGAKNYVFESCTAEFVSVPPFTDSLKTTIDNKEYEVPTLKAFNELKQRIEALEKA